MASDGELSDSESISITVVNVNRPPVFSPLDDKTVFELDTLSFTVVACDPDGDNVELVALDLPNSAAFDAETGAFSWTPKEGAAGASPYLATFSGTDSDLTSVKTVSINVIAPEPPAVEFSRASGSLHAPFYLQLSCNTPGAEIRYSEDGSIPDDASSLYTQPFLIDETRTVRARAFLPGGMSGAIRSESYFMLAPDVLDFDSNLPVVIIETFGQYFRDSEPRPYLPVAALFIDLDEDTNRAALAGTTHFAGRAGMHIRGSSSTQWPKKQFSFELWDEADEDTKFSLLGLPPESDWMLYAPYSDKTLMRNHLAYMWSNRIGRYAPRTRFFELFLSVDGSRVTSDDYHGVYVLIEKIKRDDDRVDVAKLEATDTEEPEITGGYIIKHDRIDPGDSGFTTSRNVHLAYVEPKEEEIAFEQAAYLGDYIDRFEAALYGSDFTHPTEGYARYIDTDSFVDHHILVELMKNGDGFRLSTFSYKDRGGKLMMGPIWDYNLALGNRWDWAEGNIPTGWYRDFVEDTWMYPWWGRLFEDALFAQRWIDRWALHRMEAFDSDLLSQDIDETAALLAEAAERNFERWPILGTYVWGNAPGWETRRTYQSEVDWIKDWWLPQRLAWIDDQQLRAPEFSRNSEVFLTPFDLSIYNPNGTGVIYYTLDGTDPITAVEDARSEIVLVPADAPKSVLIPTGYIGDAWTRREYDDAHWTHGSGGVGYERVTGYDPYFDINVDAMYGLAGSCYLRTEFDIDADQIEHFDSMSLHMRFDDGFVAYLNGTEIARANAPDPLGWGSTATALNEDQLAVVFREFDVTASIDELLPGKNVLAIHGLNKSFTSSDFLIAAELTAIETSEEGMALYQRPIPVEDGVRIIARASDGERWSPPTTVTFVHDTFTDDIRISEIMYHPAADREDLEFIEVTNVGAAPIDLEFVRFSKGIDFVFPSMELVSRQFVIVARDYAAFVEAYGSGVNIAGEYSGALSNGGERIRLENALGEEVLDFEYQDGWQDATDGEGFSLTIMDAANSNVDAWSDKAAWRPSALRGGSPGTDDGGMVPVPGSVVINEILAHSDGNSPDWIELHNTTASTIDIGGWFLSDDESDLTKYEIAQGVSIGPNGYRVFWEDEHFGLASEHTGAQSPFALSENGETVYLRSGSGGDVTGYAEQEDFGASQTDVAFGRYEKSTGTFNFVAMSENTPGEPNAYPKVGPIVISEVMYSPAAGDQAEEYIELLNVAGAPVNLADVDGNPWKFTQGVDFTFAPGTTVAAGERLLVVKDVAAFTAAYPGVPVGVRILGPYGGRLSNGGEKIELSVPGDLDTSGERLYIRIDRLAYDNEEPWPLSADAGGHALTRLVPDSYGNDVANWDAAPPAPGQ